MRDSVRSTALSWLTRPGIRSLYRPWTRSRVPILMMHRFSRDGSTGRTSEAFLDRLCRFLVDESYEVLTLGTLCSMIRDKHWPSRAVCLTVDDGYADFAEIAFPVLRRHGLGCTVFLVTRFMDGSFWNWWDRVDYAFRQTRRSPIPCELPGGGGVAVVAADGSNRRAVIDATVEACKQLPEDEKWSFIRRLEVQLEVELPAQPVERYRSMGWEEARRLAGQGIEFGAHTVTHPILSRLSDERAGDEALDSIRTVQRRLHGGPVPFCYPNGRVEDFTPAVVELLERHGVPGAVTTVEGILSRRSLGVDASRFYTMPRIGVPDSMPRFIQMVSGLEALKRDVRGAAR